VKIDRRYSRRSVVPEFRHRTSPTNRDSSGSMAEILNPSQADLAASQYAEEAMKKGIPILKRAGFESVEDLPRTAVGFSSKAYQDLPPQLRLSATSNGEQRVRVRVLNAQGLHHTTQFLMQEYLNLVDWKGFGLPSTEKRCKASVKKFERSPTVLAEWIELKEALAKFQAERGNETSDDKGSDDMTSKAERKRKSDASSVEFCRRSLAGGNV